MMMGGDLSGPGPGPAPKPSELAMRSPSESPRRGGGRGDVGVAYPSSPTNLALEVFKLRGHVILTATQICSSLILCFVGLARFVEVGLLQPGHLKAIWVVSCKYNTSTGAIVIIPLTSDTASSYVPRNPSSRRALLSAMRAAC